MMDDLEVDQIVRVIWSRNPNKMDVSGKVVRVSPASATVKDEQSGRLIVLEQDDDWEVIG